MAQLIFKLELKDKEGSFMDDQEYYLTLTISVLALFISFIALWDAL